MALSYPRAMPEKGISTQAFEPERFDYASPETSGRIGGITAGWPLWQATWTLSRILTRDMSDEWRAWLLSLRGAQRSFLAVDRDRLYPRQYPDGFRRMTKVGGAPFLGAGSDWTQTIDASGDALLEIEGLPSGMILGLGDYVGFRWDAPGSAAGSHDRRAMVRIVRGGIADAAGTVSGLVVEPPVNVLAVPSSAEVHLDRPACLMRINKDRTELGALDRRLSIAGGTIAALQDLRP